MNQHQTPNQLDHATSARLAKLGGRPIDTTRLQQQLEHAIADATRADTTVHTTRGVTLAWHRWWRPITSAAAAVIIALTIGWLALDPGTAPAMAAPASLAQLHHDVARGLAPQLKVASVEEANRLLAQQASGAVPMPNLPGAMMSCCLHQHAGAILTCAQIDRDGQVLTIAIADGTQLHSPTGQTIIRGERRFIAHTANGINMVMAHDNNRWLCVMGEASFDELADVAAAIRF